MNLNPEHRHAPLYQTIFNSLPTFSPSHLPTYSYSLSAFCLLPSSYADYADGDGSPEFPYEIAEPNQLIYMSQHPEHWSKHFLLTADINMNLITREVVRAGQKIDLQPLEFSLLEYLLRNAGRVVSKTMIMEHVWDYYFDPQTNVVESRIYKLREKIDKGFSARLIHTVRGVGYVLKENK